MSKSLCVKTLRTVVPHSVLNAAPDTRILRIAVQHKMEQLQAPTIILWVDLLVKNSTEEDYKKPCKNHNSATVLRLEEDSSRGPSITCSDHLNQD